MYMTRALKAYLINHFPVPRKLNKHATKTEGAERATKWALKRSMSFCRAVSFLALIVLLSGCGKKKGEAGEGDAPAQKPVVSVRVAPIINRDVEVTVIATGRT